MNGYESEWYQYRGVVYRQDRLVKHVWSMLKPRSWKSMRMHSSDLFRQGDQDQTLIMYTWRWFYLFILFGYGVCKIYIYKAIYGVDILIQMGILIIYTSYSSIGGLNIHNQLPGASRAHPAKNRTEVGNSFGACCTWAVLAWPLVYLAQDTLWKFNIAMENHQCFTP